MKQPIQRISIQGYNQNWLTADIDYVGGIKETCLDGKKLTQINIQAQLFSKQDVQELINFLQISKFCFSSKTQNDEK